jgi:hypothetical protein
MIKKIFTIGKIRISLILKHRWQKNQDRWEKDKWDELRLGLWFRYYKNPHKSLSLGSYLIVAKTWISFSKSV